MRAIFLAALLVAGCSSYPDLPVADTGTIAGTWREVRRDGHAVTNGYWLSIGTFSSFAVRKGCVVTGGMLRPVGGSRYRIDRYETGFGTEGCGLWRSGPEVAPFDGAEVGVVRNGTTLVATGAGHEVQFRRIGGPIV